RAAGRPRPPASAGRRRRAWRGPRWRESRGGQAWRLRQSAERTWQTPSMKRAGGKVRQERQYAQDEPLAAPAQEGKDTVERGAELAAQALLQKVARAVV